MLDDGQIVGDEQIRDVAALCEVVEQIQDLGLDRDIQRGDRLIADDEVGRERERAGDADALALAAGEFVGIAGGVDGSRPTRWSRPATSSCFSSPRAMP